MPVKQELVERLTPERFPSPDELQRLSLSDRFEWDKALAWKFRPELREVDALPTGV